MTDRKKPDWKAARQFVAAIYGDSGHPVTLQAFDDQGKDFTLAGIRYGSLKDEDVQKWIIVKSKKGCGIYITINECDGEGRRRENVTRAMACAVDLDGAPLPKEFPIKPDIIVKTSPGRYHLYWLLVPTEDLNRWSSAQACLAAYYQGDSKIIDPPRVLRLPGFDHLKTGTPFRVKLIQCAGPKAKRHTVIDLIKQHPGDYQEPAARASQGREDVPEGGWDKDGDLYRAGKYLEAAPPSIAGEHGNDNAFAIACRLNDMGISPDASLDLMAGAWNDRCAPPWSEAELEKIISNATRYKQDSAGSKRAVDAADEFEGDDEPQLTAADFEGEDDAMPIFRLNDVTIKNVDKLFKFVNLNGRPRILYWGKSALDPLVRVPQFWSVDGFKDQLCNKFYLRTRKVKDDEDGEEKEEVQRVSVASSWLTNPKRRTYDGVVLVREQISGTPDSINLWRGYGFEENTSGDWSLLKTHIRDVIAKGDPVRFDYIVKWIAWGLQHPTEPAEVALILKSSDHGAGKGMLLRAVRKLYGAHGMQISKGGLITGRFNAHLAMTCFLFIDEMTLADNKESATLNSTLTEDAIAIEPKGVDSYMMPNHLKIAAASNQEHVVLAAGSDRRFQIFEVSNKVANNHAYFGAIQKQLDEGGYGKMLHDLLAMDLDEWHPRQLIKDDKTPEKVASTSPDLQWLAGFLDSGHLPCQVPHRGGVTVDAGSFYEHARHTVRGLAGWTDNTFAAFLKTWQVERRRSDGTKWVFPPLADMRAAWAKKLPWWPPFDLANAEWQDDSKHDADDQGDEFEG